MFDLTISILKIGHLLGKPFLETLGVREGGVEFPILFSIYIDSLRTKLETEHPRLCRMWQLSMA
eukprot:1636458-Karenia_brevis.AAC.1